MADSILSGLDSFGLGGLEGMSLFEDEKKAGQASGADGKPQAPVVTEKDFLLDKSVKCPLCYSDFKMRAVKGSKARLLGTDVDLRPRYAELDVTKYDVVMCPVCGYTALTRFFPTLLDVQKKRIKEKISINFKSPTDYPEVISYDKAIERYKMALVNAIVKGAKASEKAYICLKASWVVRGKMEEVEDDAEMAKYRAMEAEFSKNAYEGFTQAVQSETFPMCGMDEVTIDYLLAVLGFKTDHLDVTQKMLAKVLTSPTANARMKDKARDLKDEVIQIIKSRG